MRLFMFWFVKVFQLSEKDFETKMDYLFKKHSFEIAISLAKEHGGPNAENSDTLAEIYTQYGSKLSQPCVFFIL